jgi:hypothetical protein
MWRFAYLPLGFQEQLPQNRSGKKGVLGRKYVCFQFWMKKPFHNLEIICERVDNVGVES